MRIMYDTDLFPLEVQLKPNEGWGSASARLILAATEKDFADPRWVMPTATTAGLRRPFNPSAWHYNTWDPFGTRIDEARRERERLMKSLPKPMATMFNRISARIRDGIAVAGQVTRSIPTRPTITGSPLWIDGTVRGRPPGPCR